MTIYQVIVRGGGTGGWGESLPIRDEIEGTFDTQEKADAKISEILADLASDDSKRRDRYRHMIGKPFVVINRVD